MDFKFIYLAKRSPNVSEEDWPATWRSHAAFVRGLPGVAGGLTRAFYCSRVMSPALDGAAIELAGVSRAYDGVAMSSSPVEASVRPAFPLRVASEILKDEVRVFGDITPNFSFACRETLVHGDTFGKGAVIRFLARKQGATAEAFNSRWRQHADIAKRAIGVAPGAGRYVHNQLMDEPLAGFPFDGISEMWFASEQDAIRSLGDGELASVAEDLPGFCDMARSVTMLTHVIRQAP